MTGTANPRWALDRIEDAHGAGATTIVHLGNFGYWVPDPATCKDLFRVNKRLRQLGMRLLLVDGNPVLVAADGAAPRPALSTD